MSVRSRIVLVLLLVCTAFVAGVWAIRQDQQEYFTRILKAREDEWRSSVEQFLRSQERPAAATVEGLADNLETVLAIEFHDPARLARSLEEPALKANGVQGVWVYSREGVFLFSRVLETAVRSLNGQSLPGVDVTALAPAILAGQTESSPFYFLLPGEIPGEAHDRYFSVRAVAVTAKVAQPNGAPRVLGYLFAGCLFGPQEVAEMTLLHKDDHVILNGPDLATEAPFTPAAMVSRPHFLHDWQGRRIGQLAVRNDSAELAAMVSRGAQHLWVLLGGVLTLFCLFLLWLSRSIMRPLGAIIEGLHKRKLSPLAPLERENSELGELARLIQAHFDQRDELVQEMSGRVAAQTALRKSEEMLRHSQKMEAVGRLAGGVAHDFNNLLTAIIGYADLLDHRLQGQAVAQQEARLIHQAGEQAAGLTRQLLAFSRKQLLQPKVIDLNAVIQNLHRLLQRIIGEHIEIQTLPLAPAACVRADPGQIEQVIINLGVNARDAMPRGGRLKIETRQMRLEAADNALALPAGDYAAVEVTDTGAGMDLETQARIFEPFFTTKGPGKGTGLGLATVYGIVKQSGGAIQVESEVGRGSTFRILLPLIAERPEEAEVQKAAPERPLTMETILVVEDEDIVRELVCEVLRENGYRTLATASGSEALLLLHAEGGKIDLLISDVVMPEMNGAVVAQRVREVAPHAAVLFVSGYSESDMEDQGLDPLSFQVLQKPFRPAVLAEKVREVLDSRSVAAKS